MLRGHFKPKFLHIHILHLKVRITPAEVFLSEKLILFIQLSCLEQISVHQAAYGGYDHD